MTKEDPKKISTIKSLFKKYYDVISYLFFGVCTTVINIAAYAVCAKVFGLNTVISTIIAWFVAVAFAYITNRIWVFRSKNKSKKAIFQEIVAFFVARLATGLLDLAIMYVCVDLFHWSDIVMKVISNIIVIILNYVASKLIIFTKKKD